MFSLKIYNDNNFTIYILKLAKTYCETNLNIVSKLDC